MESIKDIYRVWPMSKIFKVPLDEPFPSSAGDWPRKQKEQTEQQQHYFPQIGKEFRVLVGVLNVFGNSPLGYNKEKGDYEFRWFSWLSFYTFIVGSSVMAGWVAYVGNLALNRPVMSINFRLHLSEAERLIHDDPSTGLTLKGTLLKSLSFNFMTVPLFQIWEMICGWKQSAELALFLNTWAHFTVAYNKSFSPLLVSSFLGSTHKYHGCSVELERDFYFFKMKPTNLLTILLVITVSAGAGIATSLTAPTLSFKNIFYLYLLVRLMPLTLVEDVKTVFMYKNVAEAFSRIHAGILYHISTKNLLSSGEVKGWRDLVLLARRQCVLVGEYQRPGQLGFYVIAIVNLTLFMFTIFNIPKENSTAIKLTVSWTMFSCIIVVRTYVKVWMAEKITKAESLIAAELSQIEESLLANSDALTQIKFTHDIISQNKSEIRFGNYVTLNKGLLLRIFNQVITYLIVIMQFMQN